jgi:cell division cycle 20-like protein 1 (cofactor of APC complex)
MSGLKNSPFGKRLRAAQQDVDDDSAHRRNRPKIIPMFPTVAAGSTPSLDSTLSTASDTPDDSPRQRRNSTREREKEYGDRFVPNRDSGDIRTSYHLKGDSGLSTPSKSRIIPTESDALKGLSPSKFLFFAILTEAQIEQANSIFTSILQSEVTPPSIQRPPSPIRASTSAVPPTTPTHKRLFAYASPSRSIPATPSRRLDNSADDAYSMSPVRAESRQLLESPRRRLRSVCKTPYRVLDAPDLADDFYLNLVDWSSTNVLGVGLGASVYLWSAETAAVSKLCDLTPANDTISSVSWVQKVRLFISRNPMSPTIIREQPLLLARYQDVYIFTMHTLFRLSGHTIKLMNNE